MLTKVNNEAFGQIATMHVLMKTYPFVLDVPQVGTGGNDGCQESPVLTAPEGGGYRK